MQVRAGVSAAAASETKKADDQDKEKELPVKTSKAPKKKRPQTENKERVYVDKVGELDVLCGRGGRSNHHPGNKRYRQVVSEMKASYRNIGSKSAKTDLSRAIVDHVYSYGGRFLKMDKASGKYFVLSIDEGRKKTSQALREAKTVKWTA